MDINSLIAQTETLSWDDPFTQIDSLIAETVKDESLPLVGHIIFIKHTTTNQFLQPFPKLGSLMSPFRLLF